MSAEGLEPSTNGLKGHCSTIELRARNLKRKNSIMAFERRQSIRDFLSSQISLEFVKLIFLVRVDDFLENCYTLAHQVREYVLRA